MLTRRIKVTEIETGATFKIEKKTVERKKWVFLQEHPYQELQAKKKGEFPLTDQMLMSKNGWKFSETGGTVAVCRNVWQRCSQLFQSLCDELKILKIQPKKKRRTEEEKVYDLVLFLKKVTWVSWSAPRTKKLGNRSDSGKCSTARTRRKCMSPPQSLRIRSWIRSKMRWYLLSGRVSWSNTRLGHSARLSLSQNGTTHNIWLSRLTCVDCLQSGLPTAPRLLELKTV